MAVVALQVPRSAFVALLALALQDVLVTAQAAGCLQQFSKLFGKLPAAAVLMDVISAAATLALFAT